MRVHERENFHQRSIVDSNEYEDYEEEQEEDESDYEEEDYQQEDPKPTKEQLEYLELRQRLKEKARQRLKKESSVALGRSEQKKRRLPYDNYGSFFGPSQPVIAQRVIEESRAIIETQHIAAKVSNSHSSNKKGPVTSIVRTTSNVRDHRPKVVNEVKKKVQTLKDTRDYSFLLSDDAELPAPAKEPAPRKVSVPNSDARLAQVPSKSKLSTTKPTRPVTNDRYERRSVSTNRPVQSKVRYPKAAPANRRELPTDGLRKRLGTDAGSGPGRPVERKLPPKVPAMTMEKKKISSVGIKSSGHGAPKAPLSKPHSSVPKQYSEQKREPRGPDKSKMLQKQPMPSSKSQMKPPKQMPPRALHEDRLKKRPAKKYPDEDEDDDGEMAIRMIRNMFRYNPDKYAGDDDDASDMEANFDDIQKEERVSSKIGRAEDERELRLIEEEERRERLRKEAKKRRLNGR